MLKGLLSVVIIFSLFWGCSEPVSEQAHSPVIRSFSLSRSQVYTREFIEVEAVVADADKGDKLSFQWSADAGTFANPGNVFTQWQAPADPGNVTLRFKVSDGFFVVDTSGTVKVLPQN